MENFLNLTIVIPTVGEKILLSVIQKITQLLFTSKKYLLLYIIKIFQK